MSNTSVIQVRVSDDIKDLSEKRAKELGFASVQEAIRVFLSSFSSGFARPSIVAEGSGDEVVYLSEKAKKRYKKILKDIESGKDLTVLKGSKDLVSWLEKQKR